MSRRDIAVVVKETPIHIVEVRTGVQGKRGPEGVMGPPGAGLQGPPGKDMRVITTDAQIINVTPENHGDFYVSLNEEVLNVAVVLGYTSVTNALGELVDTQGAAAFFVQSTEAMLNVIPLNEDIEIELPLEKLNRPFGKGSTIGVVAKGNNKWTLFGDLAADEVVVELDYTVIRIEELSGDNLLIVSLAENVTGIVEGWGNAAEYDPIEGLTVQWEWDLKTQDGNVLGVGSASGPSHLFDTGLNFNNGAVGTVSATIGNQVFSMQLQIFFA